MHEHYLDSSKEATLPYTEASTFILRLLRRFELDTRLAGLIKTSNPNECLLLFFQTAVY